MRAVLTFENGATTIADVWLKPNSGGQFVENIERDIQKGFNGMGGLKITKVHILRH